MALQHTLQLIAAHPATSTSITQLTRTSPHRTTTTTTITTTATCTPHHRTLHPGDTKRRGDRGQTVVWCCHNPYPGCYANRADAAKHCKATKQSPDVTKCGEYIYCCDEKCPEGTGGKPSGENNTLNSLLFSCSLTLPLYVYTYTPCLQPVRASLQRIRWSS